ncbi:hypothetical protein D3C81_2174110 [compost metagenome]
MAEWWRRSKGGAGEPLADFNGSESLYFAENGGVPNSGSPGQITATVALHELVTNSYQFKHDIHRTQRYYGISIANVC